MAFARRYHASYMPLAAFCQPSECLWDEALSAYDMPRFIIFTILPRLLTPQKN